MNINFNNPNTIRNDLASLIDNPNFIEMEVIVQNCIIAMYQAVNKFIIENKLDTENDW